MRDSTSSIRKADVRDLIKLSALYAQTVRTHAPSKYDDDQVAAWAAFAEKENDFSSFIMNAETWLMEDHQGPTGFAGLEPDGHIPSLYVRGDCTRQGIGKKLLNHLLQRACDQGIHKVHSDASQFSKPLFEKLGFHVEEEETAHYDGVQFLRWKMAKDIV